MNWYFLFDASAAHHYYLGKEEFQETLAYLIALKEKKQAFFFLPNFCVAEVLNTFAKYRYRLDSIEPDFYNKIREDFIDAVRNRKTFYCYYLNRYHNLNAEVVFGIEHTRNTEFQAINEFPQGRTFEEKMNSIDSIVRNLRSRRYPLNKFYLSTFDILIIAMAMELRRFFGERRVYIVTKDERLKTISEKGKFSKVIYLPSDKVENIKARLKPS